MTNIKKVSFDELKEWSLERYGAITAVDKDMTIGQFFSYLFLEDHLTALSLREVHKVKMKAVVEQLGDTPIKEINKEVLNNTFSKIDDNPKHIKVYRNSFKRMVLDRASELSLLDSKYDYFFMERNIIQHKELRSQVSPEERTVGWYVCELCARAEGEEKSAHKHPSAHTHLKRIFYPIWGRKMKDFCLEWIVDPDSSASTMLRPPIELAIADGVLKNTDVFETKEAGLISVSDDLWEVQDGRKKTKLDFSTLDDSALEKKAMKSWMRDRVEKKLKGHAKYKNLVEKHFLQYLKDNNVPLNKFSNAHKKKWISQIKEKVKKGSEKCGSVRNALSSVKQFIKHLRDSDSDFLKKDITWSKEKDYVNCDTNKRSAYPDWELQAIVNATMNDRDRMFSLTFTLLMLTAKRLDEILTLKRDCLIDISGVKCLRYTNNKLNKEETYIIPSFGTETEITLFKKSSGEKIIETINKIKEMTEDLARRAPERYSGNLLLYESKIRDRLGYNIVPLLKSSYYSRLYDFKKRNRITFRLEAHRFRHTIGTATIRSGKGIESAAKALGNKPKTVARYYEDDISKEETLQMGESIVLDVKKDAKRLIDNKAPEVLNTNSDVDFDAVVPGGICKAGKEAIRSCKFYNRLFGSGGCIGCSQLGVTEENEPYYKDIKMRVAEEFEQTRGTPFSSATTAKLDLISTTLRNIKDTGGSK